MTYECGDKVSKVEDGRKVLGRSKAFLGTRMVLVPSWYYILISYNTIYVFIIFQCCKLYHSVEKRKICRENSKQYYFGILFLLISRNTCKIDFDRVGNTHFGFCTKYLRLFFFDFPTNKFYCNTFPHNFFMWLLTLPCKKNYRKVSSLERKVNIISKLVLFLARVHK